VSPIPRKTITPESKKRFSFWRRTTIANRNCARWPRVCT
jgi:hypothetical protein